MGSRIRCFFLAPTNDIDLYLRRYRSRSIPEPGDKCTASGMEYHNVDRVIERTTVEALKARGWPAHDGDLVHGSEGVPKDDPRWPQACACGLQFTAEDHWQCNPEKLYRRSDTSELVALRDAPVGAMWDAHWMSDIHGYKRIDGMTLCVRTPGGEWCVDGPSYSEGKVSGAGWSRSGVAPDITANPSILIPTGNYHGFLRAGFLEEC